MINLNLDKHVIEDYFKFSKDSPIDRKTEVVFEKLLFEIRQDQGLTTASVDEEKVFDIKKIINRDSLTNLYPLDPPPHEEPKRFKPHEDL